MDPFIRTDRLLLRPWRKEDLEPFAVLNADPEVMECLPKPLTREESDELASRLRGQFEQRGYGRWAVEVPGVAPFIGFVGLACVDFPAAFTPCVEIGWRLAREHWVKGYAGEAARASIRYGFEQLGLEEIVSFTVPHNVRSRAVMERLGMTRSPDEDFDHPVLPEGHPLRRHVLYRIQRGAVGDQTAGCGLMGLDFSHGDAHFGHGSSRSFRRSLAAMTGISIDEMEGFGGQTSWETVTDPIAPLLWRNDAGGELTSEEARDAAARLEELMADERNREEVGGCQWEDLLAGLKDAAEAGEPFVIMG